MFNNSSSPPRHQTRLLRSESASTESKVIAETPSEILIVFTDFVDDRNLSNARIIKNLGRWYFLKSGFAHCFMLMCYDDDWVLTDPLFAHIFQCKLKNVNKQALIRKLRHNNCRILSCDAVDVHAPPRQANGRGLLKYFYPLWVQIGMLNMGLYSCVTIVKRSLNIRDFTIITPYQLYCFLKRTKKEYI